MSTNEPPAGPPHDASGAGSTPPPPPPPGGSSVPPPPPGGEGTPPPPAGGYAAPPGGYAQPPAAGGYGTPPPAGAYGAPPTNPSGYSIGDALQYGWAKFQANLGQFIVAGLILVVGLAIMGAIGFGIMAALTSGAECTYDPETGMTDCDAGTGFFVGMIVYALIIALTLVVALVISAGIIRGCLGITEGRPFQWQEITRTDKIGPVLVTSLLISVGTFIGLILCYIPGLIFAFLSSYALYFVLDKGMAPMDAIKASISFTKDNLGQTLLWYLVSSLVMSVGFAICFVGGLVSVPVALIGTAYTYKKLTGQPVAA